MTASSACPSLRPGLLGPAGLLLLVQLVVPPLWAAPQEDEAQVDEIETSLVKPLASKSLLLDGAAAGDLMVVVGERGHVLLSRDDGASWRQVEVPTRSNLTAVFLLDDRLGWAVGHDAVILRTRDGGESWERLFWAPEQERPLFDVWFRDADNGFVIGAYGFFMTTSDGGDSWVEKQIVEPDEAEMDEDADPYTFTSVADLHLNHIARAPNGTLYIAAEAGSALRSDDGGETWVVLEPPYEGSFFASLPLAGDTVLLFGLRGNLFRSDDAGGSWRQLDSGTVALLTDGLELTDGTLVITGLAGTLLVSRDGGESFTIEQRSDRQGLASLLATADGGLVLLGEFGITRVDAAALAGGPGQ